MTALGHAVAHYFITSLNGPVSMTALHCATVDLDQSLEGVQINGMSFNNFILQFSFPALPVCINQSIYFPI